MARLTVSNGVSYNPGAFFEFVASLDDGTVIKHQDDLWRVSFNTQGEVFVRGNNFDYNGDDELISGDITSFSINQGGSAQGEYGPALFRIRGLDNVSAADIHNAIETHDNDALYAIYQDAFKHDDVMDGADQRDNLIGFKGDDNIEGHGRSDYLVGGGGGDRIDGGGGQDYIIGGSGNDDVYGGGDSETGDGKSDTFVFLNGDTGANENRADRVHDFVSGTDLIDLSQTGADETDLHFHSDHGNTRVVVDAHDSVDKMVIVVVGNDHVSISDVTFLAA